MSSSGDNIPPKKSRGHVEWIGHRGAKRELPENTVAAFQRAFERGANAVELDVHATADGVLVVHHDPTLGRTAGSVAGRPISSLSEREVTAVELDGGITVPTLESVLAATPRDRRVYIEIKGERIEHLVAELVERSERDCAVHSFDHDAIARLRDIAPAIARGILFEDRGIDIEHAVRRTGARDVWPSFRLIDQPMVDRIHALGCRVIAWTVNSADVAADLIALGVDGLCGDDVRIFPMI